jgi:hypothetical protein
MRFKGLDGHWYSIEISRYRRRRRVSVSDGQQTLGDMLEELYDAYQIYEEFPCLSTRLHLDFYIHGLKLAFEFDGPQHKKFTPHFHKTKLDFARSKRNDTVKEDWCDLNSVTLVRVVKRDIKTIDKLKEKILSVTNESD